MVFAPPSGPRRELTADARQYKRWPNMYPSHIGAMAMVERSAKRKSHIRCAELDVTIQDCVVRMLERALDVESEDDREARSEPMGRER
jgi:hypothetical protein